MKIYAIDDEKHHLKIYEVSHGAIGFSTPGKLIDALCESKPDLLICDLMMPKVDGWTIISIARQMYPELPIIIGTAMDDFVQKQCAEIRGCKFWSKGDLLKLRQMIEEVEQCIKHTKK